MKLCSKCLGTGLIFLGEYRTGKGYPCAACGGLGYFIGEVEPEPCDSRECETWIDNTSKGEKQ